MAFRTVWQVFKSRVAKFRVLIFPALSQHFAVFLCLRGLNVMETCGGDWYIVTSGINCLTNRFYFCQHIPRMSNFVCSGGCFQMPQTPFELTRLCKLGSHFDASHLGASCANYSTGLLSRFVFDHMPRTTASSPHTAAAITPQKRWRGTSLVKIWLLFLFLSAYSSRFFFQIALWKCIPQSHCHMIKLNLIGLSITRRLTKKKKKVWRNFSPIKDTGSLPFFAVLILGLFFAVMVTPFENWLNSGS